MSELAQKECVPCKGGVPPLRGKPIQDLLAKLGPNGWRVVDEHHLEKEYSFPDFVSALAFVNRVGRRQSSRGITPTSTWAGARCG